MDIPDFPDNVRISTMTINCRLFSEDFIIDLLTFYNTININENLPYIEYYDKPNKLLLNKGITIKKKKRDSTEIKKNFQNQTTMHILDENKKKVNLKLFKNGTLQMTGIKNLDMANSFALKIIDYLKKINSIKEIISDNNVLSNLFINDIKIRLINSDFFIGYEIKSINLFNLLVKEQKRYIIYGTCESYFTLSNKNKIVCLENFDEYESINFDNIIFDTIILSHSYVKPDNKLSIFNLTDILINYKKFVKENDIKIKNFKFIYTNKIIEIDLEDINDKTFIMCNLDTEYGKTFYEKINSKITIPSIEYIVNKTVVSYEPCTYPGVKIHYYWNKGYKENEILKCENLSGNCCCNWLKSLHPLLSKKPRKKPIDNIYIKCSGKMDGNLVGGCRRITISVFQSGNIIITGAQTMEQIRDAYLYIKDIFNKNEDYLKKTELFLGDIKLRDDKIKIRKKYKLKKDSIINNNSLTTLEKYFTINNTII
jgi:TATA-box binding protein (TBP) (component of TFIID and TFIIIB)